MCFCGGAPIAQSFQEPFTFVSSWCVFHSLWPLYYLLFMSALICVCVRVCASHFIWPSCLNYAVQLIFMFVYENKQQKKVKHEQWNTLMMTLCWLCCEVLGFLLFLLFLPRFMLGVASDFGISTRLIFFMLF